MSASLGEALPEAIAKVSEWIGQQEAQAKELDEVCPSAGDGQRFMASVVRVQRDRALAAQQSGDVVAMIAAYQLLKPALELASAPPEKDNAADN
jgi:phage-related minor tail protein